MVLLDDAKQEWLDSALYYEIKQKGLGERFSKAVEENLELISNTPKHYKKKKKEYREVVVKHFPFLIVFRIDESKNCIVVVSIFHSKRHPKLKIKKV